MRSTSPLASSRCSPLSAFQRHLTRVCPLHLRLQSLAAPLHRPLRTITLNDYVMDDIAHNGGSDYLQAQEAIDTFLPPADCQLAARYEKYPGRFKR